MLQELPTHREGIVGFEAKGKIEAKDYQEILLPLLEKFRAEGKKIRFLFYLGPDFTGFTPGATWEDFKLGLQHIRTFERCAVVSDTEWIRSGAQFVGSLIPCPFRTFKNSELNEAQLWLDSGEIGLDHHLDESTGVLKIEISAPLTSENFEILSHKIDTWIDKDGKLNGLVIHAREFRGWEDIGSFISHIEFIKNHHQKIGRVALCADGLVPNLMPLLAKHFVKAEVKHFPANQLDQATTWASLQ